MNLVSSLEQTSDRLCLRDPSDKHVKPAQIPFWAIKKAALLRKRGYLPNLPHLIIINNHHELVWDLNSSLSLSDLVNLIKNLCTHDQKQLQIESPIEALDFYITDPSQKLTHRLRYYFAKGRLFSTRIIIADVSPRKEIPWQHKNLSFLARSENFFITRQDLLKTSLKIDKKFFAAHKKISALVYKKSVKGNFGQEKMWDHRRAVFEDQNGREIDATDKKHILGMGPYISLAIQKFKAKFLSPPMVSKNLLPLRKKIIKGDLKPRQAFEILTLSHGPLDSRIELECKNYPDGPYLAYQLSKVLRKEKIKFSQASGRKIGINFSPKALNQAERRGQDA